MPYYLRLMQKEDVSQVTKIDREAFPEQWPAPNYQSELRNRLSHYLVACDADKAVVKSEVKTSPENNSSGLLSNLKRLFNRNRSSGNEMSSASEQCIIGFIGLWVLTDEAHITAIAVRGECRQQGIGELLLISAIDLATKLKANIVTLEVRASNTVAQSLYAKHGFTQVGVRRGYYMDNRESALIMSTQSITSTAFQAQFQQLKKINSQKCGAPLQ